MNSVSVVAWIGIEAIPVCIVGPGDAAFWERIEDVDYPIVVIVSLAHQSVSAGTKIDICWHVAVDAFAQSECSLYMGPPAVYRRIGRDRAGMTGTRRYFGQS
jgi:hypothetical protein|tara:strand:- start:678 stop:983 length:306 start_codon:yes stop_codon:yes gene_type:complete